MNNRVSLLAAAVIAGYVVIAAAALLIAWSHTRRVDQLPTMFLTFFSVIAAVLFLLMYPSQETHRGIVFAGTFFGLILLPWLGALAVFGPEAWKSTEQLNAEARADAPPVITDISGGMLDVVEASVASYPDGTSITTIRHPDTATARAGLEGEYGGALPALTRIAGHEGVLNEMEGVASFQFLDGAAVIRVTGTDRAALERRLAGRGQDTPQATAARKSRQLRELWAWLGGTLAYALFISWVFLRLATWAASFPPLPGAALQPASTLRERLLGVARADVPFTVMPGSRPDELVAEWRYADAKWLDQMRAHRLSRLIRYRLRLDEATQTVRVLEYRSEFDASAGGGGASLSFHVQRGITFFEKQRYTVLGLQIKDGRITLEPSYSWSFDVNELRRPLVRIVTEAGWTWRQVMLDVPWLTG